MQSWMVAVMYFNLQAVQKWMEMGFPIDWKHQRDARVTYKALRMESTYPKRYEQG